MPKVKELREQSEVELKALCEDISREIFQLRNEMKASRQVEQPHHLRLKKKERARVLTILREKEIRAG